MTLTKDDLHAIKQVLQPEFERLDEKITAVQTDMRGLFMQQGEHLSKAISDAVKLIAQNHPTREEFQELQNEVDDLKEKVRDLLGTSRN